MRLYHAGKQEIARPDIHAGRKNADFGWGFYLTPDKAFSDRWAGEGAVVNTYELDEKDLDIHVFQRDAAWFDYIFNNRRFRDGLKADVVIGPIANDTIFDTLGIITSGLLTPAEALSLLSVGPRYTQIAIKTQKAADNLCFIASSPASAPDQAARQAEQDAYQAQFGQALEQLLQNRR